MAQKLHSLTNLHQYSQTNFINIELEWPIGHNWVVIDPPVASVLISHDFQRNLGLLWQLIGQKTLSDLKTTEENSDLLHEYHKFVLFA